MAFAILRMSKMKSEVSYIGTLKHHYRQTIPQHAFAERSERNLVWGQGSSVEAAKVITMRVDPSDPIAKARLKRRYRGERKGDGKHARGRDPRSVLAVEYMVTASPDWFREHGWRPEDNKLELDDSAKAYFEDSVGFLDKMYGRENFVCATLHLDEQTPHLHCIYTPIDSDGKLNAKAFTGDRAKLKKLQTDFANEVGARFGLQRGKERQRRAPVVRHVPVAEFWRDVEREQSLAAPFEHSQGEGHGRFFEEARRSEDITVTQSQWAVADDEQRRGFVRSHAARFGQARDGKDGQRQKKQEAIATAAIPRASGDGPQIEDKAITIRRVVERARPQGPSIKR